MPSNVAQAIGTAQQFMQQPKNVYEKKLLGVQQNWNVTAEQDDSRSRIGKTLEALGVSIGQNDLEREKQQYEIAQTIAPQFFDKLTNEQKRKLTNAEILANTGEYNLSDNRYAVGVLDKLRGEHLSNQWNQEYTMYSMNQPLANSLEEEHQRYEQFMNGKFDEWQDLNNGTISNQYAFFNGYYDKQAEHVVAVSQSYLDNKERQVQQDRVTTIHSKAVDVGRFFQYSKDLTDEQIDAKLMELQTYVNITQGKNPEIEFNINKDIMETLLEHSADQRVIDRYGEFTDYRGRPIKETLNPVDYRDRVVAKGQQIANQQALQDQKELDAFTSVGALDAEYTRLQNSDKLEDKEKARRWSTKYYQRRKELEIEEKQRQARMLKEQTVRGTEEWRTGQLTQMIRNTLKEDWAGVIPQTEKELDAMGLGGLVALNQAMLPILDELAQAGDDAGLARLAKQPIMAKGMQAYFKNHLDIDLTRGVMSPAIELALKYAGRDGNYIKQVVGEQYAPDVTALKLLVDTHGVTEGMQLYREGRQRLDNPDEKKRITDEIKLSPKGDIQVYDLYWDAETPYTYSPEKLPPDMIKDTEELAIRYRAFGFSTEQSLEMARIATQQKYVAVNGVFIPTIDYQKIVNMNTPRTNEALEYAIRVFTNDYVSPAHWYSNGSDVYLSVIENGTPKQIPLSKIINQVDYSTQWFKDHPSEDNNSNLSNSVLEANQDYQQMKEDYTVMD